jgi:hypothetical protein
MYVTYCMHNCTYVVYSSALCIKYNYDTSLSIYVIEFITSMTILSINEHVVYTVLDVMIVMRARSITRAIERGGP